ncbi:ATP synthase, epsilon chain [Trypanosoma cruzi cruzi]|uniref:Putative ATP synthase, epsilon chain n=1 Tax=Trypanosoma cruzi TaxID=5693 RepID=A0A2V2VK02_TRYCR|nr:mitochondrial ATP synthase delta chain [Trypanosoma cruzi]PBJ80984.1 ATP synthase, epsilon chain [Trypanosoma cruzi cruzi]PWU96769.1 putative ATP synthase, epsilon chain [Trypanosoma cruzi]
MFRAFARRLVSRTLPLLQVPNHDLPEGFEFLENKVVDKDIHATHENLETLRFTLTRQDEFLMRENPVKCVTVTGVNGEYGIYPGHAYKIVQLVPAPLTVEFTDGTTKKYFVSGGFAHINNEGSCDVNAVECVAMEDLDLSAAEKALAAQQASLGSAKDEKAKAVIEIRISVLESVISALKHHH